MLAGGTSCGGGGAAGLGAHVDQIREAGLLFSDVLATEDDTNDCDDVNEYDAEGPDTAATPAVLEVDWQLPPVVVEGAAAVSVASQMGHFLSPTIGLWHCQRPRPPLVAL